MIKVLASYIEIHISVKSKKKKETRKVQSHFSLHIVSQRGHRKISSLRQSSLQNI